MHSGGGTKEGAYDKIYIEAPEAEARVIFYNRFGHNPDRVSCTCCGPDYSITQYPSLEQATAYHRGCGFSKEDGEYIEGPGEHAFGRYRSVEAYALEEQVLVLRAQDITDAERVGDVPEQGYVWVD
jgi:hypothetical protein